MLLFGAVLGLLSLLVSVPERNKLLVEQPFVLFSWFVWGVDDICTHFVASGSVDGIYHLKDGLFSLYESMKSTKYLRPGQPQIYKAAEYTFDRIHATTSEPLVFKGLFANSRAIQKWPDITYLNQTIGKEICPVLLTNANRFEIDRVNASYSEILDTLVKDKGSSVYVSGDQFVFESEAGKKLWEDFEIEDTLGVGFMESELYSTEELYLFLGNSGNSGTSWHCAPNRSMFVQVLGRKKWTFIHPRYSMLLRPQRSHLYSRIFLAGDSFQYFHNEEEKCSGRNSTVHSEGKVFDHVPRLEIVLEPGDALTVPSWYWHHVENLSSNTDGTDQENLIIGVDIDTKAWNRSWKYAVLPFLP